MSKVKTTIDVGYAVTVEASLDEFAVLFPKTELNGCEIMKHLYIAFWDIIFSESVVPQNQSLILLYLGLRPPSSISQDSPVQNALALTLLTVI